MNQKKILMIILFLIMLFLIPQFSKAQENQTDSDFCTVYFTGIGCAHCAKADPVVLTQLPLEYSNLVVVEYEIYQNRENAFLLYQYNEKYASGLGVPLLIFGEKDTLIGDNPILKNIRKIIEEKQTNPLPCLNGLMSCFCDININDLPGFPKIWQQGKILIKSKISNGLLSSKTESDQLFKKLLKASNIEENLKGIEYEKIMPLKVALSGQNIEFTKAIKIGNWVFQWNGLDNNNPVLNSEENQAATKNNNPVLNSEENQTGELLVGSQPKFTIAKILSLAIVDSINPCALAVLILMLTAILTYNPRERKNIILAGLAFVLAVFVMYLIYGLFIVKFFQIVQGISAIRLWLYKSLGVIAIILGILNIRDFVKYKPGGLGTEMPMFMRPKVKKIISGITSPKGAFGIGLFVTLFLLPCTIGPYIIVGGILSALEFLRILPLLVFYNLIFVIPMLVIIGLVYWRFSKIEDISSWKEKNIDKLHLMTGLIMLILGIAMVFSLI
ncbi:hypothetical protein B6D52_03530 [Candidatus Parcubacteria bacterium 4484_255]|nr:MAG: hypothetical protein B6D52_03530 [Candidatus Parcubacteria bacterium 4484_255]